MVQYAGIIFPVLAAIFFILAVINTTFLAKTILLVRSTKKHNLGTSILSFNLCLFISAIILLVLSTVFPTSDLVGIACGSLVVNSFIHIFGYLLFGWFELVTKVAHPDSNVECTKKILRIWLGVGSVICFILVSVLASVQKTYKISIVILLIFLILHVTILSFGFIYYGIRFYKMVTEIINKSVQDGNLELSEKHSAFFFRLTKLNILLVVGLNAVDLLLIVYASVPKTVALLAPAIIALIIIILPICILWFFNPWTKFVNEKDSSRSTPNVGTSSTSRADSLRLSSLPVTATVSTDNINNVIDYSSKNGDENDPENIV